MEEAQFTDVASPNEIQSTATGGAETRGHLYQVKGNTFGLFYFLCCCSRSSLDSISTPLQCAVPAGWSVHVDV